MSDNLTLRHGPCEVELGSVGAEMMAWRVGGRDLLWDGDARFWARRSPILFPLCGWTNGLTLRAKGRAAKVDTHGFGRSTVFDLARTGDASARFSLSETAATLAEFPYRFDLTVDVALSDSGVAFDFAVHNPGDEVLPFALGYHPGFRWPFDGGDKADYRIVFDAAERPAVPLIAPGGLFTDRTVDVPMTGRKLSPAEGLGVQDSLFIRDSASAGLDFVAPSGARIRVETEGFPHWVLWSKPGGDYYCIERWSGEGDPVGFAGDITEKPGQTLLAPGETQRSRFACSFSA